MSSSDKRLGKKPVGGQRTTPGVSRTTGSSTSGTTRDEMQSKISRVGDQLQRLQRNLLLSDVQDEIENIDTTLALLPAELERLRTRGYVFRSFLERKLGVLQEQWGGLNNKVRLEVNRRVRELEREASAAETTVRQASPGLSTSVSRAETAVSGLESKINAAKSACRGMYSALRQNVDQTKRQITEISWLLDQVDEASFRLYPAEDAIVASRAQMMEGKKDGPSGILYLTDERLIFEQKEEIATKKVLFITTEKEKVQQLIFEAPVGQIEEITTTDKGFLGRKEILDLAFSREAPISGATLQLQGATNEDWAGAIGRVKAGDMDKERATPKDEEVVEAARSAPTKCPTCGATLAVTIVRGMREINCEYCGSVIRL